MFVEEREGVVVLHVKVVPNSSRTVVAGMLGEELKVKVVAVPEEGKANRAVEELLAKVIGVGKGDVSVVGGMTRARKTVEVRGVTAEVVRERLISALGV